MPPGSATARGRRGQAYTSPVVTASAAAISAAVWLRPWIARSMRLAAAKITHAHQATTAPGSRNTLLWSSFRAWSDDTAVSASRLRGALETPPSLVARSSLLSPVGAAPLRRAVALQRLGGERHPGGRHPSPL